jgi:hypothetical protein
MSRVNTPSLINGSTGRPGQVTAGKRHPCRGCGSDILKGETCFNIPNPRTAFGNPRRYCAACFRRILEKTKADIATLERGLRN